LAELGFSIRIKVGWKGRVAKSLFRGSFKWRKSRQ